MKKIPYGHQWLDRDGIAEVSRVLESDWLTQGPKINEFEDKLCKYAGAKYAVCVSNGTAALHLACLASGIKRGDEVITSPMTFIASANCVLYCGGKPVFADIDPDTVNINPENIEQKITKNTKAMIPVHFAGNPCDLKQIRRIANKHKLMVIEDAAHALGAGYKGKKVGSCRYSDMTIFSFHPVKSITTGEGGAILTNHKKFYDRLLTFRNHGIIKDKSKLINKKEGNWYYEMQELGFNYRITDFQSALGISQLKKLDYFIERRSEIANKYTEAFRNIEWFNTLCHEVNSALHLYILRIDFRKLKMSREEVMQRLRNKGIFTQVHYIPVHLHPYYSKNFGYGIGDYPKAEDFYRQALSIPIYPKMTNRDVDFVIKEVKRLSKKNEYSIN